jgi:hypothetical protein
MIAIVLWPLPDLDDLHQERAALGYVDAHSLVVDAHSLVVVALAHDPGAVLAPIRALVRHRPAC